MARIYYKTYYRCNTENQDIHDAFPQDVNMHYSNYTFNGLLHTDGSYTTTMPSWFTQVDGWPLTDTGWSIDTPNESGTHYKFSWTAHKPGGNDEYIVELIMLDYCAVEVHNTNCNARVLTWLTREGGWAYFTFSGKSTFEVKIPQGKTFQNSDYVLRYNSRPDVYTGEQLSTGSIPEGTLELLESLK